MRTARRFLVPFLVTACLACVAAISFLQPGARTKPTELDMLLSAAEQSEKRLGNPASAASPSVSPSVQEEGLDAAGKARATAAAEQLGNEHAPTSANAVARTQALDVPYT